MQLRLNKPGLENTTGKDIPVPMQLFYHGEQKVHNLQETESAKMYFANKYFVTRKRHIFRYPAIRMTRYPVGRTSD